MDKGCVENWNIKGVDRVTSLRKTCPVSPKTPDKYMRPLMKIGGLFLFHTSNEEFEIGSNDLTCQLRNRYGSQILGYLRAIGCYCGKTKTMGVRRGKIFCFDPFLFRGFPDISGFKDNKIFFVEVKSAIGKQTPEQVRFQEFCQKAGLTYILARDLLDVQKIIK